MPQNSNSNGDENKFWQEIKSWVIIILIALGLKTTIIASYMVPTGSMENTIMTGDFLLGNQFVYGARTPTWIGIPWTRHGFRVPSVRLPRFKTPQPGDIVIFKYPVDPALNYVKRCIAGPGETVEIRDKVLYVDDHVYEDPEHAKYIRPIKYPSYWKEPGIFPYGGGNADHYGPIYVPAEGDTLWFGKVHDDILQDVVELARRKFEIRNNRMYVDGKMTDYYVVEQDHYFMIGDNRDNSLDSRYWGYVPDNLILGKAMVVFMSWDSSVPLYRFFQKIRWKRIGKVVS